jgi:hypothetical protein
MTTDKYLDLANELVPTCHPLAAYTLGSLLYGAYRENVDIPEDLIRAVAKITSADELEQLIDTHPILRPSASHQHHRPNPRRRNITT